MFPTFHPLTQTYINQEGIKKKSTRPEQVANGQTSQTLRTLDRVSTLNAQCDNIEATWVFCPRQQKMLGASRITAELLCRSFNPNAHAILRSFGQSKGSNK